MIDVDADGSLPVKTIGMIRDRSDDKCNSAKPPRSNGGSAERWADYMAIYVYEEKII